MRYLFLEQIYLQTGSDPVGVAHDRQLEDDSNRVLDVPPGLVEDLERLGFLVRSAEGPDVRITEGGIEYLRRGAWRRRSIRM